MQGDLETGMRHLEAERFGQARKSLQSALQKEPQNPDVLAAMAKLEQREGQLTQALQYLGKAVEVQPQQRKLYIDLMGVFFQMQRFNDVLQVSNTVFQMGSDYDACFLSGAAAYQLSNNSLAAQRFTEALEFEPRCVQSLNALSNLYQKEGNTQRAEDLLRDILKIQPREPDALNNYGALQMMQGKFEESYRKLNLALQIQPQHLQARKHMATVCQYLRKSAEAREHMRVYLKSAGQDLDAAAVYAQMLLSNREWRLGWDFYRVRVSMRGGGRQLERDVSGPVDYKGARVAVLTDQGLGDELFFSRFVPQLRELGAAEVHFVTASKISSILTRSAVYDSVGPVVPAGVTHQHYVADLPYILRLQGLDPTPPPLKLSALEEKREQARKLLKGRPSIGFSFRAGTGGQDPFAPFRALSKQIPQEDLVAGLQGLNLQYVCLQRNLWPGELDGFSRALGAEILDLSEVNDDLELMLAVLLELKLYVGVSNTNHHLLAGLNRPGVILVTNPPEFRQFDSGETSEWYPQFQLFREEPSGWKKAMKQFNRYGKAI